MCALQMKPATNGSCDDVASESAKQATAPM
jgi:hypothetical protein